MTYSIGPINLKYLTNHSFNSGGSSFNTSIPRQSQTLFLVNKQPVSYTLNGAFFATTAEEARLQRKQLNELISNPCIEQVYISFDEDDPELSGWFSIDSLETMIDAAIFENYSFNLGVKRLLGNSSPIVLSWRSNPYNSVYTITPQTWLPFPPKKYKQYTGTSYRVGEEGSTPIVKDVVRGEHQVFVYDETKDTLQSGVTSVYDCSCKIFDARNFYSVVTYSSDPPEDYWVQRYGININFVGPTILSNNLIRYVWENGTTLIYLWTGSHWEAVCSGLNLVFGSAPTLATSAYPPIIEYYDWNKIIWYESHLTDTGRNVFVRYKMLRGSNTLHVWIKSDFGTLDPVTNVLKSTFNSHSSYDENVSTANYCTALSSTPLGTAVRYGFFYTEGTSGGSYGGGTVNLGYTKNEKEWTRLGLHINKSSIPSPETVLTLSAQFLANMDFKEKLVNPVLLL